MARALQHSDRSTVMEHLRSCFKNFLEGLDVGQIDEEVRRHCRDDLNHIVLIYFAMVQAETRVISAFKELVVKLNEATFRPLFRRLYDWAFTTDSGASVVLIYPRFTSQSKQCMQRLMPEELLLIISTLRY